MDSLVSRLIIVILFLFVGCESSTLKRPFGTMRLLPLSRLQNDEEYFPKLDLLLRHDNKGWYVMSTADPVDLASLKGKQTPEGVRWFSAYSNHVYDNSGKAVGGDTKASLPFYKLEVAPGPVAAPELWIYARIGDEADSSWRLIINATPAPQASALNTDVR